MLYDDVNFLAIIHFFGKCCSTSHFFWQLYTLIWQFVGRSTRINGFLLMITYVSTDQWELIVFFHSIGPLGSC